MNNLYIAKYVDNEYIPPQTFIFFCNQQPTPEIVIEHFNIEIPPWKLHNINVYMSITQITPDTIIL